MSKIKRITRFHFSFFYRFLLRRYTLLLVVFFFAITGVSFLASRPNQLMSHYKGEENGRWTAHQGHLYKLKYNLLQNGESGHVRNCSKGCYILKLLHQLPLKDMYIYVLKHV